MNTPIVSVRSAPAGNFKVNTPGRQTAVFLDRDGVFDSTDGFVNTPDQLDAKWIPGSIQAIAKLSQNSDVKIILVTNQGGIDEGHMSEAQNQAIQERFEQRIEEAGGHFDALYFSPNGHKFKAPEGEVDARKPNAGMFFQAAHDFGDAIDLHDSYMIGDMTTDIAAGKAADPGLTTILVKTGFGGKDNKIPVTPDRVEDNLGTAVDYILSQVGKH